MSLQLQREKLMHLREAAVGPRETPPPPPAPRIPADPGPSPAALHEAALTLRGAIALDSVLDGLSRDRIPSGERFEWQPEELVAVLGEHAWRHWGDVTHVAFSPDGRQVASVGEDGVRVWDRRAAESPRAAFHLPGACRFIAFSPDWRAVLTLEEGEKGEGLLHVWDLSRGVPTPVAEETCAWRWTEPGDGTLTDSDGRATSLAIHPSSQLLAIGHADGTVRVRQVKPEGGWDLKLLVPGRPVTALAFSPDERFLVLGLADGHVQVWELVGPMPRPSLPYRVAPDAVAGLAFGADGVLAVACRVGPVRLLRLAGLAVCADCSLPAGSGADVVSFAPQGRLLAVWAEGVGTKVLDLTRSLPRIRWEIQGRGRQSPRPGQPVAFAPNGTTLAVGDRQGVVLWDLAGDQPSAINPIGVPMAPAGWLAFSPDGSLLAAAGSKGPARESSILVWPLGEGGGFGKPVEIEGGGPVVFSTDGQTLAGCDEKRQIRLWKREGDAFRPSQPLGKAPAAGGADSLAEVTIVDRRIVHVAGLAEGSPFATAGPKIEGVLLAASPAGNWVAAGTRAEAPASDEAQTVTLWAVNGRQATSQRTAEVRGEVLAVSPDGNLLLTSAGGKVMVCKVGEAEPIRLWWFPGRVVGAAFAHDGRHLALGNANGTIYVLRLPDEVASKQ